MLMDIEQQVEWKSAQRRCKHCAPTVVSRTHKQSHKHTNSQERLQYTVQL